MKNKTLNLKNKSGFTLIEIMIAVIIIGIFAFSIFLVLDYIKIKSADTKRVTDMRKIEKALELYYDSHAVYPPVLADLVREGLLSEVPRPALGAGQDNYSYVPLGSNKLCTGFHLGASMQDKSNIALQNDADTYPAVVCELADKIDFDGTAVYCQSGKAGEGVSNDTCFDIIR